MSKTLSIIKLQIETEQNVVDARQRARQIAALLGFENQDQIRLATAVSELARNAFQYAGRGMVDFALELSQPQTFFIKVSDQGPGIPHLAIIESGTYVSPTGMGIGLMGSKKLSDVFEIETAAGVGTKVRIGSYLKRGTHLTAPDLARISEELLRIRPDSPLKEMQRQNAELIRTMEALRERQDQLADLNKELNDTNRGVVAFYAELDEKASSLQRANDLKTSFLSNMTHEFRTPLTSILSLSRLLLDRMDGPLTEEQEKQVRFIRQSGEGLLELVSDLLDIAKVEAGKVSLKVTEFETVHVLAALRGVFKPMLPLDSSIEFVIEPADGLPALHTDEGKVSQILRNLVSNAFKFTERGVVSLAARHLDTDEILFTVTDDGIGIAESDRERVFDDFSQIESSLQGSTRGTGLGLPLSRKLARLLGGDLWVESRLGKGSNFYVRIPRVYRGAAEASLIEITKPTQEKRSPLLAIPKIVLIDEDETSRYVLKNLTSLQVTASFHELSDGVDALKKLREIGPSLIFLDLALPGVTGLDLLRDLKSDDVLSSVPVCINTALNLNSDERDFLDQLTIGTLSKERSHRGRADEEIRNALIRANILEAQT